MRVDISHEVDRAGDQVYNFLTYEFQLPDGRIRARAYADTMSDVMLLGRFNADGTSAAAIMSPLEMASTDLSAEQKIAKATAFFEATDARRASGFPEVLEYLRSRFRKIQQVGLAGPEIIATGFTFEEYAAQAGDTAPQEPLAQPRSNQTP